MSKIFYSDYGQLINDLEHLDLAQKNDLVRFIKWLEKKYPIDSVISPKAFMKLAKTILNQIAFGLKEGTDDERDFVRKHKFSWLTAVMELRSKYRYEFFGTGRFE